MKYSRSTTVITSTSNHIHSNDRRIALLVGPDRPLVNFGWWTGFGPSEQPRITKCLAIQKTAIRDCFLRILRSEHPL